ncbi:MAG: DEAD/DEAH box helicase [Gammaproteobacteria bacterium]|nr:DEAD/DEAH box helicase [Gammaproteobacteria bacterium]
MPSDQQTPPSFDSFGLSKPLLKALDHLGYETPSPIQEQCITHLLNGCDIIGQAQTGTGKTAAFALPLLQQIDIKKNHPQVLVLAPTRELAIQVAEAIQSYAHFTKGFHVLPIYGGQSYNLQLRPLKRGVHVVVGTPGRVMDHIKRGTLKLDGLKALVLDEADEMLRMGFIDDVKWVLEQIPKQRQIALFSATMPAVIRKIADQFLHDPKIVKIKSKTTTATTIRQRYWQVSGTNKLDALTRILEVEEFDGLLIFVRTKTATAELAEKLQARGFAAEAINGDIAQNSRERIITQLKNGKIDILIATDVAARGLDVERISHVVNYDIPYDPESYVHRIGRTGRAGRKGEAILFVAPRENRMLKMIEKVAGHPIEPMQLPSAKIINEQRVGAFKQKITDTLANRKMDMFEKLIHEYHDETGTEPLKIAAALAQLAQGEVALFLSEKELPRRKEAPPRDRAQSADKERKPRSTSREKTPQSKPKQLKEFPEIVMRRYKIDVGSKNEVKPSNIVGAIANEADLESRYIGSVEIYDNFSTVDLPDGMPKETFMALKNAWVCGKKLNIAEMKDSDQPAKSRQGARDKATSARPARKRKPKASNKRQKTKK